MTSLPARLPCPLCCIMLLLDDVSSSQCALKAAYLVVLILRDFEATSSISATMVRSDEVDLNFCYISPSLESEKSVRRLSMYGAKDRQHPTDYMPMRACG